MSAAKLSFSPEGSRKCCCPTESSTPDCAVSLTRIEAVSDRVSARSSIDSRTQESRAQSHKPGAQFIRLWRWSLGGLTFTTPKTFLSKIRRRQTTCSAQN
jgi:hypothetical protein